MQTLIFQSWFIQWTYLHCVGLQLQDQGSAFRLQSHPNSKRDTYRTRSLHETPYVKTPLFHRDSRNIVQRSLQSRLGPWPSMVSGLPWTIYFLKLVHAFFLKCRFLGYVKWMFTWRTHRKNLINSIEFMRTRLALGKMNSVELRWAQHWLFFHASKPKFLQKQNTENTTKHGKQVERKRILATLAKTRQNTTSKNQNREEKKWKTHMQSANN